MSKEVFIQDLVKKYGQKVFQPGTQVLNTHKRLISVSPALDIGLGGGIPQGSVVRLTGAPKAGKTVTALWLARNAQMADPDVIVVYLNIEGRIKDRDLEGISGLDLDRLINVTSFYDEDTKEGKILTAEDYLEIGEHYLKNVPKCVVIVDSISQLVTADELTSELSKQHRSPGSLLMARFTKRNSNIIAVNKCILIGITHKVANISGFGAATSESGGTKIKYATDVALDALIVKRWTVSGDDDDESSTQIGQKVTWRINTTATNYPPGQKIVSWIRYGTGIDELVEMFELGVAAGFIKKGGSWFTLVYMENHLDALGVEEWDKEAEKLCRTQGHENAINLLRENPKWQTALRKELMSMFGVDNG